MQKAIKEFSEFYGIDAAIEQEARRLAGEQLRDDDITIKRIMEKHNITEEQARKVAKKIMEPLVLKGEYIKVQCQNPAGGGRVSAWRKNE